MRPTHQSRSENCGPSSADSLGQRIQAKATTEASGPAKRIRTSSVSSSTNPDPAKRTKTGPPHHVFNFRFAKPAKSRPATFNHLSRPRCCSVQPRSNPTERTSSLASPYPLSERGMEAMTFCSRPLKRTPLSRLAASWFKKKTKKQLDTGHCLHWSGFGYFLCHFLASWL